MTRLFSFLFFSENGSEIDHHLEFQLDCRIAVFRLCVQSNCTSPTPLDRQEERESNPKLLLYSLCSALHTALTAMLCCAVRRTKANRLISISLNLQSSFLLLHPFLRHHQPRHPHRHSFISSCFFAATHRRFSGRPFLAFLNAFILGRLAPCSSLRVASRQAAHALIHQRTFRLRLIRFHTSLTH